jgi:hypothetical protein
MNQVELLGNVLHSIHGEKHFTPTMRARMNMSSKKTRSEIPTNIEELNKVKRKYSEMQKIKQGIHDLNKEISEIQGKYTDAKWSVINMDGLPPEWDDEKRKTEKRRDSLYTELDFKERLLEEKNAELKKKKFEYETLKKEYKELYKKKYNKEYGKSKRRKKTKKKKPKKKKPKKKEKNKLTKRYKR